MSLFWGDPCFLIFAAKHVPKERSQRANLHPSKPTNSSLVSTSAPKTRGWLTLQKATDRSGGFGFGTNQGSAAVTTPLQFYKFMRQVLWVQGKTQHMSAKKQPGPLERSRMKLGLTLLEGNLQSFENSTGLSLFRSAKV